MSLGEMASHLYAKQEQILPKLAEQTGDMALAFVVAAAAADSGCNDSQEQVVHSIETEAG